MSSQNIAHPQRWRETCDPFSLKFNNFELKEVLGYPHAGNDVFHVRGSVGGREITAYIKVARQIGADIKNEVNILSQLHSSIYPDVIDYDRDKYSFSVTAEMEGLRLSNIVGDNKDMMSLAYMEEYGGALARLHTLTLQCGRQADRKFYHRPANELLEKFDIAYLSDFFAKKPQCSEAVFCHGDFHYANILWRDGHISAILDFELAGYGDRDFDIAWALFLRPGQRFLRTEEEFERFIHGYTKYAYCNVEAVRYYMAQCYAYFLGFGDAEYCDYARNWLIHNCQ